MASFVLVASAQAAVTTSSITSPSDPFFGFDQGQTQNVTISGTSNGNSSDSVDILCYNDNGSSGSSHATVASNVPVSSGGSFSTTVPITSLRGYTCRLRAVPSGTAPTSGLSSYSGPRISVGYINKDTTGTGALYDYYAYAPQLSAADDYASYAGCGLDDSYLFDPSVIGQRDTTGFYCNDWADNPTESNSSRTAVLVDGHPAYAPSEENNINSNAAGFQPLVINSVSQDSTNGNVTIVETDPLVRCAGDAYPANSGNCAAFISSGVQVKRTITQTDDGHIVYIRDSYSSTDAAAHSVNLLMENDQHFYGSGSSQNVEYEFPGQSSFSAYNVGQSVSVPATAPASILIENAGTADGATNGGRGAITYAQPPSGAFAFGYDNSCCSDFDAPNTATVPASGSANIGYAYSSEYTLASAQHDALVAQDAFQAPALKITSPKNHSRVKTRYIKVKGTASAGSGVKSVTVNGKTVTVSGGKFSTTVRLHSGTNHLKVVLTSEAGSKVTKTVTVTLVTVTATTGPARHVGGGAATMTGTVHTNGHHVTYYFQYGTSTRYGHHTATHSLSGSHSASRVSARITGLHSGRTYHFRLVVVYSGSRIRGADRHFRETTAAAFTG
ncbi:MAG TPA: hypothetical protein VG321_07115 [Solirubrobacteraceae bacterium]|nr:hypothetical protein [Solirubrobacteraceae bacterium]